MKAQEKSRPIKAYKKSKLLKLDKSSKKLLKLVKSSKKLLKFKRSFQTSRIFSKKIQALFLKNFRSSSHQNLFIHMFFYQCSPTCLTSSPHETYFSSLSFHLYGLRDYRDEGIKISCITFFD